MRQTTRLRELLRSGQSLVVPGCYNALSARILAQVGFPALYMTGYGTSLSLLGMPDAGLATMTEMHLNARYIAGAVPVPVIADADNGYGNAINVIRTVREYVGHGRGRHPHRGPGHPQALRPRGRPPGHLARRGRRQVPRGGTSAQRDRSGLRPDRPDRRARRSRRQPRRGHPPRQCLSRGGRGHGLRGGADEPRRGAPRVPRGQGADLLQPDRRVATPHAATRCTSWASRSRSCPAPRSAPP